MTAVRRARGLSLASPLVAALLLLAACGGDGGVAGEDPDASGSSAEQTEPTETEPTETEPTETEPTETEPTDEGEVAEPTGPACSEVWGDGQQLPRRYAGCYDEDRGRWVQAMVYRCSSGQQLVTYRRTFYAAKGEEIVETDVPLARDPEFSKALETCGA